MKAYVFDTSALLTYLQNEAGADIVAELLSKALMAECKILFSTLSLVEIYYKAYRHLDGRAADELMNNIAQLPMQIVAFDANLVGFAGQYKATGQVSFADACIAALARHYQAILVHKDPEYQRAIHDIEQLVLPFKPKNI